MPSIILTVICDDCIYQSALKKAVASVKYFHPEFKIIIYNTEKINEIKKELNCSDIRFIAPRICQKIWVEENPDILIKMGADCLVLGNLSEGLKGDFDVAAARNDSDYIGNRDERRNRPDLLRELPNNLYINADFVVIKNKEFIDEWNDLTLACYKKEFYCQKDFETVFTGEDNQTLNIIFHLGRFKRKLLDPEAGDECWGCSSSWAGETNFLNENPPESLKGINLNNWPAWKNFELNENGDTILPDKRMGFKTRVVKIAHQAGGTYEPKMSFDLFNEGYRKHLKKITGFEE